MPVSGNVCLFTNKVFSKRKETNGEGLTRGSRVTEGAEAGGGGRDMHGVEESLGGDVAAEVRDGLALRLQQVALRRDQVSFHLDDLALERDHSPGDSLDRLQ